MNKEVQLIVSGFLLLGADLATNTAFAHTGNIVVGDFLTGFLHPVFGLDHVVAMVAVGMWGAFLGVPAIWLLPVIFPLVMAFGAALGIIDVPIPLVEVGIATSAIVLGLCVLLRAKPPLWFAGLIVGAFAIFHGHAHGTELPQAAYPLGFAAGFVIATGMLHLIGIAFGLLVRWPIGTYAVRATGGVISMVGLAFLFGFA